MKTAEQGWICESRVLLSSRFQPPVLNNYILVNLPKTSTLPHSLDLLRSRTMIFWVSTVIPCCDATLQKHVTMVRHTTAQLKHATVWGQEKGCTAGAASQSQGFLVQSHCFSPTAYQTLWWAVGEKSLKINQRLYIIFFKVI